MPRDVRSNLCLWYDRPALEALTEGLPLGNGHLGALVLGEPGCERLVLNEGTLFNGGPYQPANPDGLAALPEVRRLIFAGQYRAAAELAEARCMGTPKWQLSYQPLGELALKCVGHERYEDYRRALCLDTAVVTVTYTVNGADVTREYFISHVDQVLVMRWRTSNQAPLDVALRLTSEQRGIADWQRGPMKWLSGRGLGMRGRNHEEQGIPGSLRFEFEAEVRAPGGRVMPGDEWLRVRDATELVLIAAAATSYRRYDDVSGDPTALVRQRLEAAHALNYDALLARHLADHQPRFRRFSLDLGKKSESAQLPTDRRIAEFTQRRDPELLALYVQYARYLLLAASREASQPLNLQGLWNDKRFPPWGCKCTININTEMNYWPVQAVNLTECAEPLFRLVEDLAMTGAVTAQLHYGARGWVAHHNTDLWRATAPVDGVEWGLWPTGGAWLCLHLWDHYLYTLDRAQLARAYPWLEGAALFFVDALVVDPRSGYLVTCPSISPENQHPHGSALCAGPTMDTAIVRELFTATLEAARILGVDADLGPCLEEKLAKLPPYRIGALGQLQEWQEDWDGSAPEPHHRHVSHLFGLHPAQQISVDGTTALAAAARRTLELRGDAATGWSLAWKVNLWARLRDGERAYELLELLLSPDRSYSNLFDAHPPFQIDGNFGGAAGILETLVQSRPGELSLLPALPKACPDGFVKGLRARGGLEVELSWQDGEVVSATVTSGVAQTLSLRVGTQAAQSVTLRAGVSTRVV